MPRIIELSGTPWDEPCAQIGRDPDAPARSREEALAYRAALIAVFGVPPEGYALAIAAHDHDFGRYTMVRLVCPADSALQDEAYEVSVEQGLAHWHEAVMSAPYTYGPNRACEAICTRAPSREAIERALIASRPAPDGTFALDLFRKIHVNLRAAYPEQAARADQRSAAIHAQSDATRH